MYREARNWKTKAATSSRPVTADTPDSPNPRSTLRKSAAVSPTVVHRTLMSQK